MSDKPKHNARIIQLNQNLHIANSIEELLNAFLEINEELEKHLREEAQGDSAKPQNNIE